MNLKKAANKNNLIILILLVMTFSMMFSLTQNNKVKSISINEFEDIVEKYDLKDTKLEQKTSVVNISGTYMK